LARISQTPEPGSGKNIRFNAEDVFSFNFGTVNDKVMDVLVDTMTPPNVYLIGERENRINLYKELTILKVKQTSGYFEIDASFVLQTDASYNSVSSTFLESNGNSLPNIYIAGQTNVENPTDVMKTKPIIQKLVPSGDTFTVDSSFVINEFGNQDDYLGELIIDPETSNLYGLINVHKNNRTWDWGLVKISQSETEPKFVVDISFTHDFNSPDKNHYVKSLMLTKSATPTVYLGGYSNETNLSVVKLTENSGSFQVDLSYTKQCDMATFQTPIKHQIDLKEKDKAFTEFRGLSQDVSYVYMAPYNNTTNIVRVSKNRMSNEEVSNIVLESNHSSLFRGIRIDQANNRGYMAGYKITSNGSYSDRLIQFNTETFTNTDISKVNLGPVDSDLLGFSDIDFDNDFLYLAPNENKTFIKIKKDVFNDETFANSDATTFSLSGNSNVGKYSAIAVDDNHAYYAPEDTGFLLRISKTNFTSGGSEFKDISTSATGYAGIVEDNDSVYLVSNSSTNGKVVKVSKSDYSGSYETLDLKSNFGNKLVGFGGITQDSEFIYLAPKTNAYMARVRKNPFDLSGVSVFKLDENSLLGSTMAVESIVVENGTVYLGADKEFFGVLTRVDTIRKPRDVYGGNVIIEPWNSDTDVYLYGNKDISLSDVSPLTEIIQTTLSQSEEFKFQEKYPYEEIVLGGANEKQILRTVITDVVDPSVNYQGNYKNNKYGKIGGVQTNPELIINRDNEVVNPTFSSIYLSANVDNRFAFYKQYLNKNTYITNITKGDTNYEVGIDYRYNFTDETVRQDGIDGSFNYLIGGVDTESNQYNLEYTYEVEKYTITTPELQAVAKDNVKFTESNLADGTVYRVKYNVFDSDFPDVSRSVSKYMYGINSLATDLDGVESSLTFEPIQFRRHSAICLVSFYLFTGTGGDHIKIFAVEEDVNPKFEPKRYTPLGVEGKLVFGNTDIETRTLRNGETREIKGKLVRLEIDLLYNTRYTVEIHSEVLASVSKIIQCAEVCVNRADFMNFKTAALEPQKSFKLNLAQRLNQGNLRLR